MGLKTDKYERFLNRLKTSNLSKRLASGAWYFGLQLLLFGILLSGAIIGVQFYAVLQLETSEESKVLETISNRFWRLLAMPFVMAGIDFMIVGISRVCPVCLVANNNFSSEDDISVSYKSLVYQQIVERILQLRHSTKLISKNYQI